MNTGSSGGSSPWYQQIARTIIRHWWLKTIGTPLFIAVFFGAYFYLLRNPSQSPTIVPRLWLDELISFQPLSVPLYLSLWVYVSLPPAFFSTRSALYGYGSAMAATCITGLAIFYFWPTAVPVAQIDWALYPEVSFLKNIDAAGNACPSLHVATALYSCIWLHHLLSRFEAPRWVHAFNWLWCLGIVYSTLAVRQHVVIDVAAGLLLGGMIGLASVRLVSKAHPLAL